MTTRIVTIAAGLVLIIGAFVSCNRSSVGPNPAATPQPGPNSADLAALKGLFFADQSLEDLLDMVEPTQTPPPNDPLSLFASSVAASRANKTDEAKNHLKQVLALPETESRIQLWAWNGLRMLGERPPPDVADKVQGVVCELHNEAGVGTLAVYADGRARWLGGQGAAIVWEVPGSDAEISAHITKLLKAAEPLVEAAPLSDTHRTPEPEIENFRVSILTYSGIRTVEVYGPSIEQSQPIARVLESSVNLLDVLTRKSAEMESKQKPSPR
jgi:hypothetical protein